MKDLIYGKQVHKNRLTLKILKILTSVLLCFLKYNELQLGESKTLPFCILMQIESILSHCDFSNAL